MTEGDTTVQEVIPSLLEHPPIGSSVLSLLVLSAYRSLQQAPVYTPTLVYLPTLRNLTFLIAAALSVLCVFYKCCNFGTNAPGMISVKGTI